MNADDRWPPPRDFAVAALVAAIVMANATVVATLGDGLAPVHFPLMLIGPGVLLLRGRAPRLVLVATLVWLVVYAVQTVPGPGTAVPAMVALFTAVKAGHARFAVGVMTPFVAMAVGGSFVQEERPAAEAVQNAFLAVGWFVAAGVMGEAVRRRDAHTREVEQRAAEAVRTREEVALRRAADERLRIARELHDSLTHAISVIKVQAGVAVHLARKRGEDVPEALVAIQEASGAATRELRSTLGVLRQPGHPEVEQGAVGLDHLDELAGRARSAGLPVQVTVVGDSSRVPVAVDRAVFRIVQEALTNVTRHAGQGAAASVHIGFDAESVTVRVEDDGQARPQSPPVDGNGLCGMRERCSALGGRLVAGPRPEGGFAIHAEFPLAASLATATGTS